MHILNSWPCYLRILRAGPPKALDEDETEFLDKLDMVRLFLLFTY